MYENDKLKDENLEQEEVEEEIIEMEDESQEVEEGEDELSSKEDLADETLALKETIARLQADFTNYRNRTEKEKQSIYDYASEGLITKLLPIIDNLERALATEKKEDAFFEGVQLIYQEVLALLKKEGLERFDPKEEKFDPNFHHAVFLEDSDSVESEHIIETFQVGYKLKDKVIRPAMVKVAK